MTDVSSQAMDAKRRRRIALGLEAPPPALSVEEKVDLGEAILLDTRPGTNFQQVSPKAKKQLHGLLKFYANKPHPFAACVRDNTKRFGKDRAERVCAVLKDIIRGTTKWRGKNNPRDKGRTGWAMSEGGLLMSEAEIASVDHEAPFFSSEVGNLFLALDDQTMDRLCEILAADDLSG